MPTGVSPYLFGKQMSVYDRWHKSRPEPGEKKCKEHKLVPSKEHGTGKRWLVRFPGYNIPKKSFDLKVGKDPAIHADAYETQMLNKILKGKGVFQAGMTIADLTHLWLESKTCDSETIRRQRSVIEKWVIPYIGDLPLAEIPDSISDLQAWVQLLQKTLKTSTVHKYKEYLSETLTFGIRRKLVTDNPFTQKLVSMPRQDKRLITPYTSAQVNAIRAYLPVSIDFIPELGISAGLRIGEICGLSEFDVSEEEIFVSRQVKRVDGKLVFALPKGKRQRFVPLANSVRMALKGRPTTPVTLPWEKPGGEPVTCRLYLVSPKGTAAAHNTYRVIWLKALRQAGITRVRNDDLFHKLRHTFASRMLRGGLDIRALSVMMGHDDPAFTLRRYAHFLPGADETVRRIADGYMINANPQRHALDMPYNPPDMR